MVMIELEQLRKLVTVYGVEKETFLEPCLDHMRRVSHSLNLFAKLFADLVENHCASDTSKTILLEMCRRSIGVIDDCLPVAWGGQNSQSAAEFWLDRLQYVVLVDRTYEFPDALAGVDLCFGHYDGKTCLKLLDPVVAMATKLSAVLEEGRGSFFELKASCDGLRAIQSSLEKGFLQALTDGQLLKGAESDAIANAHCSLKKALSVLSAYQGRAEAVRLKEKAELDAFLEQMKEVSSSLSVTSTSSNKGSESGHQSDDSDNDALSEPEVKTKTSTTAPSDTAESLVAEAAY
ncbi:MAG: hypothetical protein ACR2PX_23690 [Endozoicomonas sp.]|uniref:hypothetical protein n=1 Tax=Endozoicomonas sp. TaxID=1892382 RepID=UPI003D9BE376